MGFAAGLDAQAKRNWGGQADRMLNGGWKATEAMPRRIIVELFEPCLCGCPSSSGRWSSQGGGV